MTERPIKLGYNSKTCKRELKRNHQGNWNIKEGNIFLVKKDIKLRQGRYVKKGELLRYFSTYTINNIQDKLWFVPLVYDNESKNKYYNEGADSTGLLYADFDLSEILVGCDD